MTRYLLYLLVGILWIGISSSSMQAQNPSTHNHNFCGVGLTDGQAIKDRMLQNRRNKAALLSQFELGRGNDSTVWVPLQFHIVTKSDGTGGESLKDIRDNLCQLNLDYADLNVEFYIAGPVRYINEDLLYTNDFGATAAFFMGMNRIDGVVNIFIGDRIDNGVSGGTTLGYFTPGLDVIYAIKSSVGANASTLTHELGHFFSLPHTFSGWENQRYDDVMAAGVTQRTPSSLPSGALVEKIARSGGSENCQIAADGFCDTDANYLFGFYGSAYNNGCDYAGLAHDPDGVLFLPEAIRPTATRLILNENDNEFVSARAALATGYKGIYYGQTVITAEPVYVVAGDTFSMNIDTLGQTDSTDVRLVGGSGDDLIGIGNLKLEKGVLTTGNFMIQADISSTNTDLSFISSDATFTVQSTNHSTFFDSIRVTNNSAVNTVASGTVITVEERLMNQGNTTSSETWTLSLPNALLPGESYTFNNQNNSKTTIAGAEIIMRMASVSPTKSGTTSENVMSYYGDNCVTGFSVEQGEAMKADIAARGYATLFPAPNDITITTQGTLISPVGPAVVSNPLVRFQWDAVNGATFYYLDVYEVNVITGQRLIGGDAEERIVTGTDVWLDLEPGTNYGWTIAPMNATNFCDAALTSAQGRFSTSLNVGVDNVQKAITTSSIYPNPVGATQEVILEVESTKEMEAKVSIFNSLGQRVMHTQNISLVTGSNIQKLNIASLSAGLYSITVSTEEGLTSHKLQVKK